MYRFGSLFFGLFAFIFGVQAILCFIGISKNIDNNQTLAQLVASVFLFALAYTFHVEANSQEDD